MSWDSDIVPAIESVKKNFPKKSFSTLWIVWTKWQLIKDRCDTHHVIWYKTMKKHILPHRIKTKHGNEIQIPEEWLT
jgi:hypothetical protein